MAVTKVRPTFTIPEMRLLAMGQQEIIDKHIRAGEYNSPVLLAAFKLKAYCEEFQPAPEKESANAQLAAYIAQARANGLAPVQETGLAAHTAAVATISPLDDPNLTEDQKFDLLNLRDSTIRTENENIWMLNRGTMIMIQRANKKPVNPADL